MTSDDFPIWLGGGDGDAQNRVGRYVPAVPTATHSAVWRGTYPGTVVSLPRRTAAYNSSKASVDGRSQTQREKRDTRFTALPLDPLHPDVYRHSTAQLHSRPSAAALSVFSCIFLLLWTCFFAALLCRALSLGAGKILVARPNALLCIHPKI